MRKMLKILNITKSWGSNTKIEGISTVILNLYRNMDQSSIQFDIANINPRESIFDNEIRKIGGKVYSIYEQNGNNSKFDLCKRIISLIKKNSYDVVWIHISMGYDGWWIIPIRIFTNVPIRIIHSHNAGMNGNRGDRIRLMINHFLKPFISMISTDMFACSLQAAKWAFSKRSFNRKGRIINNAIEYEKFIFSPVKRKKIRDAENWNDFLILGNVGRISYQKNQLFLVDLVCKMNERRPTKLVLFGGGSENEISKLKKKIRIMHAEKFVQYMGVRMNICDYLNAMDCFIFPSNYEGLGITAIEAQANGLPTLCSEYIPIEAKISELFIPVSLNSSFDIWCDLICSAVNSFERKDRREDIIKSGFDIKTVSFELQRYFEKEIEANGKKDRDINIS